MNNDLFKDFIRPLINEMIYRLSTQGDVNEMHAQMPEAIVHFIAGGVYGLVDAFQYQQAPWREEPLTRGAYLNLTQEEVRRTLDLVRLRFETGSTTS